MPLAKIAIVVASTWVGVTFIASMNLAAAQVSGGMAPPRPPLRPPAELTQGKPPQAVVDGKPNPDWLDEPLFRASEGLVGWWPADGHTYDLAGSFHGMRLPPARFTKSARGAGFSFPDGKGEISLVPRGVNHLPVSPTGLSDTFTIALWVFPTAKCKQSRTVSPRYAGTKGQRYAVFPTFGSKEAKVAGCGISVGTNFVGVFEHTFDYCPCVLAHETTLKGWVHVAVVYEKKTPTLYVNGVAVKTGSASPWTVFPGAAFGDQRMAYGPFHGRIDEVTLFKRALTEKEFKSVGQATNPDKSMPVSRLPALSEEAFAELWSALSAERSLWSFFAVHRLVAHGDDAVRRLRTRLLPAPATDKHSDKDLIAQLDDDEFRPRERATRLLLGRGECVKDKLEAALKMPPSAEVRARLERILRQFADDRLTDEQLRAVRAVTVLGRIDTRASWDVLAEIAKGPKAWPQTVAAKAMLGVFMESAVKNEDLKLGN